MTFSHVYNKIQNEDNTIKHDYNDDNDDDDNGWVTNLAVCVTILISTLQSTLRRHFI